VIGLPNTVFVHDAIWVILNRLTKLAYVYIKEIIKIHGLSSNIIAYRYPCFTSRFWDSLQNYDQKLGLVLLITLKLMDNLKGLSNL